MLISPIRFLYLQNGNYLTVYSNLSQVYVKAGDKVSTRQAIGKIFTDTEDGNATIFPATEKADGKLEKTSDTGTPLTVSDGTDSKVLELSIQDTLWGYKLPDTGGAGTTSYTAGGLALIFGAATLLYSHCRRRKEDEASS